MGPSSSLPSGHGSAKHEAAYNDAISTLFGPGFGAVYISSIPRCHHRPHLRQTAAGTLGQGIRPSILAASHIRRADPAARDGAFT